MAGNFCFNHSDEPAVARCAVCGKAVCSKCVVSKNGGNYCSEACASQAESSAGRVDTALGDKKKIDAKLRLRGIIIFVVLKLFFFPNFLKQHAKGDAPGYVATELTDRAAK